MTIIYTGKTLCVDITDAANGQSIPKGWEAESVMFLRDAAAVSNWILDTRTGEVILAKCAVKSAIAALPVVVLRRVKPKTHKVIRFVEDAEGDYQEVTYAWGHKMERRFEFLTGPPRYRREETEEPVA